MSIIDHPLDPVKVGGEHTESLIAKQSFCCYNILTSRKLYPAAAGKIMILRRGLSFYLVRWNNGMVENWKVEDLVFSGIGFKVRLTIY